MIDEVGIARRAPYALALLRIVSALIFLGHGTQKFLGFPAGPSAGSGWAFGNPGAFAGVIGRTLLFVLPGSTNAVKLAMDKLIAPELGHLVREVRPERRK